ncbi:MAG: acid phosphatase, partial [Methylocystaceae bacterium]|nr:acid phosphatase [Methylocystaceae bacterium]
MNRKVFSGLLLIVLASLAKTASAQGATAERLEKIQHIVVIVLENHSFDNMFGSFPDANGIKDAGSAAIQLDESGKPYDVLPQVMNTEKDPAVADKRFPSNLPNKPFLIDNYVPANEQTG